MLVKALPLTIRETAPGIDFVKLNTPHEGIHTGGVWYHADRPDELWKPLDGRAYANAEWHIPTREAEVLNLMAGVSGFPRNWRVVEHPDRRWLVRNRALRIPQDVHILRQEHILTIEQALRELNKRGWTIGDALSVAFDQAEKCPFILDLSAATPIARANDQDRFLYWAEHVGAAHLVALRRQACALLHHASWIAEHGPGGDWHVYASLTRPVSAHWCRIPGAHFVQDGLNGVQTWIVTAQPLDQQTLDQFELVYGWSSWDGPAAVGE